MLGAVALQPHGPASLSLHLFCAHTTPFQTPVEFTVGLPSSNWDVVQAELEDRSNPLRYVTL